MFTSNKLRHGAEEFSKFIQGICISCYINITSESASIFPIVRMNQSIKCKIILGGVCVCACVHVPIRVCAVWAAFWGMSPELCSGLAIHCPPLHNGQNHTTMRLDRGWIPGMLKYRACHSPLPLTENTQMLSSPSHFPHPQQWREEQH